MRRVFGTAFIGFCVACGSSSFAADIPAYKAPPVAAARHDWSGVYFGGNIGYSSGRAATDYTLAGAPVASSSVSPNGVIGGGQIGFNRQTGSFVTGLEADFSFSGQKDDTTFAFNVLGVPITTNYETKVDWFGTVRGRIGLAAERSLWYATGGWAYGHATTTGTVSGGGVTAPFSGSDTKSGWTIGGGIEAALTNNWNWKVEYLYLDFGIIKQSAATPLGTFASSTKVTDNVVRLGLNYRFGQ